jgi:Spy/CpxP family protein refolding chaperone
LSDNSTKAWFALFVLAVFCAGAGAGLLTAHYVNRGPSSGGPEARGAAMGRPVMGPRVVERLAETLQLTDEQKARFDAIMVQRRGRLDAMRAELRARFEAEQRDLRNAIREILTPEQQRRFDVWVRRQSRAEQPAPGPPPPGAF